MSYQRPTRSRSSLYRSSSTKPVATERRPSFLVPRIVDDAAEEEAEHIGSDPEQLEPDDKKQHFFSDQVKFIRPRWHRSWFCCVAMTAAAIDKSAVGSFPERVANNGGAAFFIVYLLAHTILTFPLMYMEGILGQYFQVSMMGVWGICPLFKSVQNGLYLGAFVFTAFTPIIISWSARMLETALESVRTADLPWATCCNLWNTCVCDGKRHPDCASQPISNDTQLRDPTDEYFVAVILRLWKTKFEDPLDIESVTGNGNPNTSYGFGNNEEGVGDIGLTSVATLAGVSVFICFVNTSRYRVAGNVYTFTVVFPLLVMVLLICRGMTLEGGLEGVLTYMRPDLRRLLDIKLWLLAVQSAVFSMALGEGIHLTIASFNPLHQNLARDVWMAVLLDSITNFMGCVASYAFLGHLHWRKQEPIPPKYQGHGFIFPFTLFPYALSGISAVPFFALLYYLMIILIAVDTCMIYHQVLTYALYEEYCRLYPEQKPSEVMFRCIILGFTFIFGLTACTRGGFWLVVYANKYFYELTHTLYPLLEIIAISWIWGLEELCHATHSISGSRPSLYLRLCWKFILPLIFLLFLYEIISGFDFEPISELGVRAPDSARYFAQVLAFLTTGLLLFQMIYSTLRACRRASGCSAMMMLLLSPEYEHAEIKEDPQSAKRLHLRHYLFLRFPDEVDPTPLHKRPGRLLSRLKDHFKRLCTCKYFKKNQVGPEVSTRASLGDLLLHRRRSSHHHHDHFKRRSSLWDLADRLPRASMSGLPPPPQPQPPPNPNPGRGSRTSTTRIGSKEPPQPPRRISDMSRVELAMLKRPSGGIGVKKGSKE